MTFVFKDTKWDDDVPNQIKFKFIRPETTNVETKKHKKKSKSNGTDINESESPGKFVRPLKEDTVQQKDKKNKQKKNKNRNVDDETLTSEEQQQEQEYEKPPTKNKKRKLPKDDVNEPKIHKKTKLDSNKITIDKNTIRDSLSGSRFRYLNEQLYTSTSKDAKKMFKEDPDSFEAYHVGFRHQIEQWPLNPLTRIIKAVSKLPKTHIIADFGCGDARLSESVPHKVYSLDLISNNDNVIECDMAHTPLDNESIDCVVFCLSLMGTNLKDFIMEANRVLKNGGILEIAEVRSRFTDEKLFITSIEKLGFTIINKDLTNKLFYFMKFKKSRKIINKSILVQDDELTLRPCLYKKR